MTNKNVEISIFWSTSDQNNIYSLQHTEIHKINHISSHWFKFKKKKSSEFLLSYLHVTAGFPPSNSEYFPHLWGISKTITPELPHMARKLFDWLKSIPSTSNLGGSVHKRVWNRDQTILVGANYNNIFCFLSSETLDNLASVFWPRATLCISLVLQTLNSIQR